MKRLITLIAVLASAGTCGLLAASSHPAAASTAATITAEGVVSASTVTGSATFSPPLTGSSTSNATIAWYPRQTSTISPNVARPIPYPGDRSVAVYVDGSFYGYGWLNGWAAGIADSKVKVASSQFVANAEGNESLVLTGTSAGSFPGPAYVTLNSTMSSSTFNSEYANGGVSSLKFTSGAVMMGTAPSYTFGTVDNPADPAFNELLGINSAGTAAGYSGSGAAGQPSQGYLVSPPYGASDYTSENYPGATQTQVTAVNDLGDSAGWFTPGSGGSDTGFVDWNGTYEVMPHPTQGCPKCTTDPYQILGLNDAGTAVGWYATSNGTEQAYQVDQATGKAKLIKIPGAVSSAATGINNAGDIVGYATNAAGVTSGWLLQDKQLTTLQYPGGSDTQALGVNDGDEIVGTYTDSSGVQHGFTLLGPLTTGPAWQSIDDPGGIGSTVVNGVSEYGALAGSYTDSVGNTDGMIITP
jgi:probable HAF family extracellular repeat protein